MTIAAILLGLGIGGLILLYLTRQRFDPLQISAARFFADLPTTNELSPQLRLQNLLLSPPFYLQLALLALLLSGILYQRGCVAAASPKLGVWLLVDTSASMETVQAGATRAELAQTQLETALAQIEDARTQETLCLRLSAFDLERRDVVMAVTDTAAILAARDGLDPRPLGTDLTRLRSALGEQQTDCQITHLYVISDQPAPEWLFEQSDLLVIWQDVSIAVDNVGFTTLEAVRNPLTGFIETIYLEVARYGDAAQSTIRITDPNGLPLPDESLTWNQARRKQVQFTPTVAGVYQAVLLESDAYKHDDVVTLRVTDAEQVRVDWQIADEAWLDILNWRLDRANPQLRVVPLGSMPEVDAPTLIVGEQFGRNPTPQRIAFFDDSSPLLHDLNLDLVEQVGIVGIALPEGMQPVLSGEDGVWLAERRNPASAYVPSLPPFPIVDDTDALRTTMFFNAVRALLQTDSAEPFFTLTTPEQPEPSETHLVLHLGEGNTSHAALPAIEQPELMPRTLTPTEEPIWPRLLVGATVVLLLERFLAAFGGRRWR